MQPEPQNENQTMVFLTCQQIEKTCAALYREFARFYQNDAQAHALFARLAHEEDDHADRFELLYSICAAASVGVLVSLPHATGVLRAIESFLEKVKAAAHLPLQEALAWSIKAEENLQVFHADLVAEIRDEKWHTLLVELNSADLLHVERLRDFQRHRNY